MNVKIFRDINEIDKAKYFIATYLLTATTNLREAAWGLAIGQSVGNPKVRNRWETEELFENHSCLVLEDEAALENLKSGVVRIAFPAINIDMDTDGVSHLLCQLMGGQMDIDVVDRCRLINLEFPESMLASFKGPKYGIAGVRAYTGVFDKPLLGGIVKPKIGISPKTLLEMVKEMVDGGVNFIKEDEIMSNPSFCKIEDRVTEVSKYCKDRGVVYAVCINADAPYALDRVKRVYELGGNAVHINFWSGLGIYKAIRDLDLPMFLHFQKSGDKVITSEKNAYSISWNVICYLAGLMGVDFIHSGMWGGYMSDNEGDLGITLDTLHKENVVPALSCGMHPGLVQAINKRFGVDWMANVGGAIHGHPDGTLAGVRAMRQAIDGNHAEEYNKAIEKWGIKE